MERYNKKPVDDGYLIIDGDTGEVLDWCATEDEANEELKTLNTKGE